MSLDALNHVASPFSRPRSNSGARFFTGLKSLIEPLVKWNERSKQRYELLAMDDRLLSDIGISRAQAEAEAAKPFWQG